MNDHMNKKNPKMCSCPHHRAQREPSAWRLVWAIFLVVLFIYFLAHA